LGVRFFDALSAVASALLSFKIENVFDALTHFYWDTLYMIAERALNAFLELHKHY
jgi:hypothetical protein